MADRTIADLFDTPSRFLRSAHLERDFQDPRALDGYILTDPTRHALARIVSGLRSESGQRAWRITGDYGTGKSSFGLLLAHLLTNKRSALPKALSQAVDFAALGFGKKPPTLYPLLIVGAREGLATALARAIVLAIDDLRDGKQAPAALRKLKSALTDGDVSDATVLNALIELRDHVVETTPAGGLLVVLDELGKFLEHSALKSDADVYLLQRLAESAARSGARPLMLVGMLHQGFHAYAEQLPGVARQEWEKVAGRFEEIVFNQPLDHTSLLAAGALRVRTKDLPPAAKTNARAFMHRVLKLGWYGRGASERALEDRAEEMFPLHPFVLPPLLRFLRRYGQHERSLFGFLLSTEPFALQDFATAPLAERWYRLHDVYDYVRASYGHLLGGQSHRSHWLRISSLIDALRGEDELATQVLKTVAFLNLLDEEDLLATPDVIAGAVDAKNRKSVDAAISALKARNLLHDRGTAGGYCLWPHTSVSLDQAYQDAERAIGPFDRVASRLGQYLDRRPLAARRHHIESGTLRHFEVRFTPAADLDKAQAEVPDSADGLVLVPLCDTSAEHRRAIEFARTEVTSSNVLLAVPELLANVAADLRRVECWAWVAKNVPALNSDEFARREAARELWTAQHTLQRTLDAMLGLRGMTPAVGLRWFHKGNGVTVRSGRELINLLSRACEETFLQAPKITHELLNRRDLSSAGAKARGVIIERLLDSSHLPSLGLDMNRAPPERSIYLSILQRGGIHVQKDGSYTIAEPAAGQDECNLRPAFAGIHEMLTAATDARVRVPAIQSELRKPPYGVRDGVWPLLLTVYIKAHEHELAFYEKGSYVPNVGGAELLRIIKAPETFEMQLCQVIGVRAEVFDRLLTLLTVLKPSAPTDRKPGLLDIVTPLYLFVSGLPEYVRKTTRLSNQAIGVRGALVDARDPVRLLFQDLPKACGVPPFAPDDSLDSASAQAFVRALKEVLDELRGAYGRLLTRCESALNTAMGGAATRDAVATRARRIQLNVRETRLRALCLRLADEALSQERWLEALGSLVVSKPPSRWTDSDERMFVDEMSILGATFQRVEAVTFTNGGAANGHSAVRVLLTKADGTEVTRVIDTSSVDERAIRDLEQTWQAIYQTSPQACVAATSRVLWRLFDESQARPTETPTLRTGAKVGEEN